MCPGWPCHNWRGLSWAYQKRQALTEGVGSNSIDVFDDDGFYSHTATNLQGHLGNKMMGSKRYIDWLLVDLESAQSERVRVESATVHTAEGTNDWSEIMMLPKPHDKEGMRGWGSDHFPVSCVLRL